MSRPANRSQLMDRFGAVQANTVWSWCAVNEAESKVYFSIWTDHVYKDGGETYFVLQEPHWGLNDATGKTKAARKDQDKKLALVLEAGYKPYGYFIVAENISALPRKIAETRTSFVLELEVARREDGVVIGKPIARIDLR